MGIVDRVKAWLDLPTATKGVEWWPDRGGSLTGADTRLRSTRARIDYGEVDAMFSSAFQACLSTITRALPQAPMEVRRKLDDGTEEPVPNHRLPALYARPNPYHTQTQLMTALLCNYYVSGDAYQQIVRTGLKQPAELYSRPAWTMTPVGTEKRLIDHYERKVNGRPVNVPLEDVLHFRHGIDERAPSFGRCGVSPIESVFGEIFTDDEASALVLAIMSNTGTMTLYTPKGDVTIGETEADAFVANVQAATTGARRGRAILAQVEMDAKRIGLTPQELDYKAVRRLVEERVAAVMCVPAMRAGLGAGLDRSTFANFKESGAALWEDCLVPLLSDIADVMTAFLLPEFGEADGLRVAFAFEKVPALQEDRDAAFVRATGGYEAGYITRNEARAEVGRESEGPAGDVYKRTQGVDLVPWQTPPEILQPAQQQTTALEAMAQKALRAGAVRGYLAAKADDATPKLAEYDEVRRVLADLEVDGLAELLDPKGDR